MRAGIGIALVISTDAHKKQTDLAGYPYINHPLYLFTVAKTKNEKIVALLHDIVEDTWVTLRFLKAIGFSSKIVHAVDCISKRNNEPYKDYIKRVKSSKLATSVKINDLIHNSDLGRLRGVDDKIYNRISKKIYDKYIPALIELSD